MGNDITGSEFKALVVVVHEAFLMAVEQISALTADGFGNKEALTGSAVIERSRVELHIAEVLDLSAQFKGESDAVAGSDSGVGSELVHSADTAGSHYHEVAVSGGIVIVQILQQSRVAGGSLFHTAHDGVFHYLHIWELLDVFQQGRGDLLTGSVSVVEDTVMAVTALEGTVVGAVGVFVELNAEFDDTLYVLSSFADEGVNSVNIVFEASGDECIVLVILYIVIWGVIYSGDTALSQ